MGSYCRRRVNCHQIVMDPHNKGTATIKLQLPIENFGDVTDPILYLWLDYSQVTGTLNQMRIA
jgi:hypothetical protein